MNDNARTSFAQDYINRQQASEQRVTRATKRSKYIYRIKWLLLVAACLLLILVISWPIMESYNKKQHEFEFIMPLASSDDLTSPRMSKPRLYGTDKNNRPYSIVADTAIQQADNKILLDNLFAEVTLENNRWFSMIADEGFIHISRKTLDAIGNIHIVSDDGFELSTQSAHYNIDQGNITGVEPVDIQGPLGTLKAKGFVFEENGEVLRFDGRVKMQVNTAEASK